MPLGVWVFRPGRAATFATLLLLPLLLALGFWQLDRARQKTEWQATFAARSGLPPVPLTEVNVADAAHRYRRVVASGRYDGAHQVLLDNQVRAGQPGYHVLTPLRLDGGAAILGYPLQPALILLEPATPDGYERDWQPRFGGFGPERHYGYAAQWFALAAALVILYLAASTSRSPPSE